jgi:hypothetical protein
MWLVSGCGGTIGSGPSLAADAAADRSVTATDAGGPSEGSSQADAEEASSPDAAPSVEASSDSSWMSDSSSCRADKIHFTQQTGCQNDGTYEFCIPTAALCTDCLARVQAIAADAIVSGSGGIAGCDASTQQLCMVPTSPATQRCEAPNGAMTDAAWAQVCALAGLPFVPAVYPTFVP